MVVTGYVFDYMDWEDFLLGVIRPTLELLKRTFPDMRHDEYVELLLLGTALQESQLKYLFQNDGDSDEYDGGLGLYQIEAATHESIWENYLKFRPDLASAVRALASQNSFTFSNKRLNRELVTNLAYATAIARLVYLPVPEQIPTDLDGLAQYWKDHFNTRHGKGTVEEFKMNFYRYTGQMEI